MSDPSRHEEKARMPDIHVLPVNDLREHVESEDCWCHPRIERVGDDGWLVVHNSADGRELVEPAWGELMGGFLEVGHNEQGEVVVNHPDLKPDADGVGHIIFSPAEARNLARLLIERADLSDRETRQRIAAEQRKAAEAIPVDRSARVLTDGSPVTDDHRELLPSGQQKGYVVLSEAERAKGFVRPVRRAYRHTTCGAVTTMGLALRAIGALARQQNVCREQAGQTVFVTGMDAAPWNTSS